MADRAESKPEGTPPPKKLIEELFAQALELPLQIAICAALLDALDREKISLKTLNEIVIPSEEHCGVLAKTTATFAFAKITQLISGPHSAIIDERILNREDSDSGIGQPLLRTIQAAMINRLIESADRKDAQIKLDGIDTVPYALTQYFRAFASLETAPHLAFRGVVAAALKEGVKAAQTRAAGFQFKK